MKRTLSILALALLAASCQEGGATVAAPVPSDGTTAADMPDMLPIGIQQVTSALSLPTTPQSVPLIDSYQLNVSGTVYRPLAARLWTDGHIHIQGLGISGPRFTRIDWFDLTANGAIVAYSAASVCTATTPTFAAISPFPNAAITAGDADYYLCYSGLDQSCTGIGPSPFTGSYAGTYRPVGDGAVPVNQGGGYRNGALFTSTTSVPYALVVKQTALVSNPSACQFANSGTGPGNIGAWVLLQLAP